MTSFQFLLLELKESVNPSFKFPSQSASPDGTHFGRLRGPGVSAVSVIHMGLPFGGNDAFGKFP